MSSPKKAIVSPGGFAADLSQLPYGLQARDFQNTMEALYDFFYVVNGSLMERGLEWVEHLVRPAAVSNIISDLSGAALAKYSNGLVVNKYHNGHPDLIPRGQYPDDAVKAGAEGVEVKSTRNAVADTHGAREGWVCQFNYKTDGEPIIGDREPTRITHIFVARVELEDFRRNERHTERGTNTSTLHRDGLAKLRAGRVYQDPSVT